MTETVGHSVVQNERGESTWGRRARHWFHVPGLHKVYVSCGRQKQPFGRQKQPFGRLGTESTQVYMNPVDVKNNPLDVKIPCGRCTRIRRNLRKATASP
jgi:hypothetical protein